MGGEEFKMGEVDGREFKNFETSDSNIGQKYYKTARIITRHFKNSQPQHRPPELRSTYIPN